MPVVVIIVENMFNLFQGSFFLLLSIRGSAKCEITHHVSCGKTHQESVYPVYSVYSVFLSIYPSPGG